MQYAPKAVWSMVYTFFMASFCPSLKENFIGYRSSKVSPRPDCIFEIHQLWQSGFSRVYSNCCCSCSFEPEIVKIGQSSHKMYSNNIVNFQESATILNVCIKKSGNLLKAPRMSLLILQLLSDKIFSVFWNILFCLFCLSLSRYLWVFQISFHWSLSDSKFPQVSRIFLSILADLNILWSRWSRLFFWFPISSVFFQTFWGPFQSQ